MENQDRDVDTNRAYIPVVNENVSKGLIRDYYNTVQNSDGKVDNVMAVHSLNPASGNAHNAIYTQAMQGPSSLSEAEREAVGLAVSYINSCRYIINIKCFLLKISIMLILCKLPFLLSIVIGISRYWPSHHAVGLQRSLLREGWDSSTVSTVIDAFKSKDDWREPSSMDFARKISEKMPAMLIFAKKLTLSPQDICNQDRDMLRHVAGMKDVEILGNNNVNY